MDASGKRLGILVVGAGFLGAQRAAAAVAARGTRLVAVTDLDQDVARRVAARYGALAAPDLDGALKLPGVDAVIVATPHADHARQVRRALLAGKHVLCEKPLAIDPGQAKELAHLADRYRLRLATGLNHRFYAPIRDALRLVDTGAIGRVEGVRAVIGHRASPEFLDGWHGDVGRSGGGTLMDNGPHACDLIRRLVGEVVAATGYVRHADDGPDGCEVEAFALFRGRDRAIAELRSSWCLEQGYLTIEVRGEEGHLHVETAPWRLDGVVKDGRCVRRRYPVRRVAERLFRARFGCERSLVLELEAFASGPSRHPRPGATGWDGGRATEMIRAVYESARTGAEVAIEPPHVVLPGARGRSVRREVA